MKEELIQYQIVEWFNNSFCLKFHDPRCCIFSVPNDTSDIRELMRKKSTGLKAGVSDLIVLFPARVIFCEVKNEIGTQSTAQKDFESQVKALGFEYYVVRSLSQFKEIISTF